jgi:hypothetical protein
MSKYDEFILYNPDNATEWLFDKLVHEVYGLTEEEIKIVDEGDNRDVCSMDKQEALKHAENMENAMRKSPMRDDIILFRGMDENTAQYVMKENLFTNKGFSDVTFNILNVFDGLNMIGNGSWYNIMKILVPKGTPCIFVAEQNLIILPRNLTLKCIGCRAIESFTIEDTDKKYNYNRVRFFAMVVKQ